MPKPLDVSIIIVSWNTRALLRECLRSIESAVGAVTYEVIVVDNASHDGSADMVATEFADVCLICNVDNHGFAAANNQGMEVASGRYVLLLNSDTLVLDSAVAKAVAFADEHPNAGIVGCRTTFPDGRLQRNCFLFPSIFNVFLTVTKLAQRFKTNRLLGRYRFGWWDYESEREVDGVAGCFMLVRRSAIDSVGPMAEHYFMYAEDADWCWRFRKAGFSVWYTPIPHIVHLHDASASQAATAMRVQYRRSLLAFIEMRSGLHARWLCNLLFFAATLLAAGQALCAHLLGRRPEHGHKAVWSGAFACLRLHIRELFPWRPTDGSDPGCGQRAVLLAKRIAALMVSGIFYIVCRVLALFSEDGRAPAVVLYYHGVTAAQKERFRQQVTWLRARRALLPLSATINHAQDASSVTFDDGFENVRQFALPVLRDLRVPATIFVVPGNLGRTPQWELPHGHGDAHERLMTASALADLDPAWIEVGSHTDTHPRLPKLPQSKAIAELKHSKSALEQLLQRRISLLSVPYGDWTPSTLECARDAGYDQVFTSEPLVISSFESDHVFGRFAVSPDDWMLEFKLKALGAYRWRRVCRTIWHLQFGRKVSKATPEHTRRPDPRAQVAHGRSQQKLLNEVP